jgi:GntR family transcriptional repressor for pyruvate dehydrogenase complex
MTGALDRPVGGADGVLKEERGPFALLDRPPTLSEEVLRRFVDVLQAGDIGPGDRLPAERELAAMLGIGRPAVREALRALSLLGIIEARPGRGGTRVVESLDSLPLEPYLMTLLLNRGRLLELMEIRQILEPEVAALAAERATDQARDVIQGMFQEHERRARAGAGVEVEAEIGRQFHLALAQATNNTTLTLLLNSVSDLLRETGRLIVSRRRGASLEWHRTILEMVLQREADEARRAMRAHLAEVEHALRSSLGTMGDGRGRDG